MEAGRFPGRRPAYRVGAPVDRITLSGAGSGDRRAAGTGRAVPRSRATRRRHRGRMAPADPHRHMKDIIPSGPSPSPKLPHGAPGLVSALRQADPARDDRAPEPHDDRSGACRPAPWRGSTRQGAAAPPARGRVGGSARPCPGGRARGARRSRRRLRARPPRARPPRTRPRGRAGTEGQHLRGPAPARPGHGPVRRHPLEHLPFARAHGRCSRLLLLRASSPAQVSPPERDLL
jgi:hypothetical protein